MDFGTQELMGVHSPQSELSCGLVFVAALTAVFAKMHRLPPAACFDSALDKLSTKVSPPAGCGAPACALEPWRYDSDVADALGKTIGRSLRMAEAVVTG